jgi:hypothetical protein
MLVGLGMVLGLAILLAFIHHWRLRAAVAAAVADFKARGEPMELAQVLPPPVPPDQNAASSITNALSNIYVESVLTNFMILNPPASMDRAIPGKTMIGWRQPVIHDPEGDWPNTTNTWDELGRQLNARQGDLSDFRKLVGKTTVDFGYDYSYPKKFAPELALRLPEMKVAAVLLAASEYYNLHRDNSHEACTDVRACLALLRTQTDDRFEITHLARFALAQGICARGTWDILQTTNASEDDLARLQDDWAALKLVGPLKESFLFERVSSLQEQEKLRHSSTNFQMEVSWTEGAVLMREYSDSAPSGMFAAFNKVSAGVSLKIHELHWRWFRSYQDEILGLQLWQTLIEGTQMMTTNHSFPTLQAYATNRFNLLGFDSIKDIPYYFISQNADAQLNSIRKAAQAETVRNIVMTAIALKRYEMRHQQLPETLEKLVPEFLTTVPVDWMDGQPLRYRRNADGTFLLYSVGENGKDDGGNPELQTDAGTRFSRYDWQHRAALDWVWPQLAAPEEVQDYFKLHPK